MYIAAHINAALAYIICVSWPTWGEEGGKLGQMYFNFDAAFKYTEDEEEA